MTALPSARDKALMLGDLDWHRFANGDFVQPVRVCRLPDEYMRVLGASDNRLLIHPSTAAKIVFKHRLTPWHFSLLPIMIQHGSVFRDFDGSLIFAYDETVMTGKLYIAVVKTTTEHHELWLKSLYRLRNKQYEKRRKRSVVLRVQI